MILLVGLLACLEKVTGEDVPLDPRFYKEVEDIRGAAGQGGGSSKPFADDDGEKISVQGTIISESQLAVDIDIRVPDATAPGGMGRKGKVLLDSPGPFQLDVPKSIGSLELQVFQDIDSDGPSGDDPFGQIVLAVGDENLQDIEIQLVKGGRADAPTHHEVAPPEEGKEHGAGIPDNPDPFGGIQGNRVNIQGRLECDSCSSIDLDLFAPDPDSPGGRRMLGKMKFPAGSFLIMIPENYGALILEAFVDVDGNGPSAGDLMGAYQENPLLIGNRNISNIVIKLEKQADGKMPMNPL